MHGEHGGPYVLVAEWIHFTLFGIKITHSKNKSVHFLGLMNSATKMLLNNLARLVKPCEAQPKGLLEFRF